MVHCNQKPPKLNQMGVLCGSSGSLDRHSLTFNSIISRTWNLVCAALLCSDACAISSRCQRGSLQSWQKNTPRRCGTHSRHSHNRCMCIHTKRTSVCVHRCVIIVVIISGCDSIEGRSATNKRHKRWKLPFVLTVGHTQFASLSLFRPLGGLHMFNCQIGAILHNSCRCSARAEQSTALLSGSC